MFILESLKEIDRTLDDAANELNYLDNNPSALISLLIMIIAIFFLIAFFYSFMDSIHKKRENYEKKIRTKKKSDKLPCYGNLYLTYYVCSKCNLVDYLSLKGNLISSFYLKWIKKGLLKVGAADIKDKESILFFDDNFAGCIDDEIERKLFQLTKSVLAMTKSKQFKADDLIKALIDDRVRVVSFFQMAYEEGKQRAMMQDLVELKRQTIEFMNFIKDDTMIETYEFESVNLWSNYFIFSNLLGLRTKKTGWFNDKINPHLIELSKTRTYEALDDFIYNNPIYTEEELQNNKRKINASLLSHEKKTQ